MSAATVPPPVPGSEDTLAGLEAVRTLIRSSGVNPSGISTVVDMNLPDVDSVRSLARELGSDVMQRSITGGTVFQTRGKHAGVIVMARTYVLTPLRRDPEVTAALAERDA